MAIQKVLEKQNLADLALVDPVKTPSKPRVSVHFGRAFVIIVETSKRTLEIFQRSMMDLREFLDAIRDLILRSPIISSESHYDTSDHDYDFNPNRFHGELKVPEWKLRSPYSPKPRSCKVSHIQEPKLSIRSDAIRTLFRDKDDSYVTTDMLGANFENEQNCCYIVSVLQALRLSHTFRRRLRARSLRDNPIAQEIKKLYNIVEGKGGEKKRQVTSAEIQHFRRILIECGLVVSTQDGDASGDDSLEEDPGYSCQFILDNIGLKNFNILEQNEHSFKVPVNSLNKPPLHLNHLPLSIGESKPEDNITELQQLITNRTNYVELEPQTVRKYLESEGKMKPEYESILQAMKPKELIPVEQTLKLYSKQIPHILNVSLNRRTYDPERQEFGINNSHIKPNQKLEIPLADEAGVAACFELVSAVTHVKMDNFSHYIAWGAYHQKGKQSDKMVYAQFDSLRQRPQVYNDSKVADEDIDTNARVAIYEFVGLKPIAS